MHLQVAPAFGCGQISSRLSAKARPCRRRESPHIEAGRAPAFWRVARARAAGRRSGFPSAPCRPLRGAGLSGCRPPLVVPGDGLAIPGAARPGVPDRMVPALDDPEPDVLDGLLAGVERGGFRRLLEPRQAHRTVPATSISAGSTPSALRSVPATCSSAKGCAARFVALSAAAPASFSCGCVDPLPQ